GEAQRIGLRLLRLYVQYAHRLCAVRLGIVEMILVGRGRNAGEADELPADLAAIAAVHRIGEIALLGVGPEEIEKELRRDRRQVDLALLERFQRLVLLLTRQLVERPLVLRAADGVDLLDADPVDLLRRQARLKALLGRAFEPRSR